MNHKERQTELYQSIWAADKSYGTALCDVKDTVEHRILPHIRRVYGGSNFTLVDFGAGDGRFLAELGKTLGAYALMAGVDLYRPDVAPWGAYWYQQPMWEPTKRRYDYAISTDALEHLPPDMIEATVRNIAATAPHGFLRISLIEDRYGTERGLHLHESVFPSHVWCRFLGDAGIEITSARVYFNKGDEQAIEVYF